MVVDRREVCKHVRKSVYGPQPSYGHLLTEGMTHGDFQGCAALSLILESASLLSTTRPLLSMTPHICIQSQTDYDLPLSCEPVNIQIKYNACCQTTPKGLGITRMSLEPNKERQNS